MNKRRKRQREREKKESPRIKHVVKQWLKIKRQRWARHDFKAPEDQFQNNNNKKL